MGVKLLYLDTETTGLDYRQHAMVQMAGSVVIDGEVKESFDFKMRPMDGQRIDPQALLVQNRTEDEVLAYSDPVSTFLAFRAILERYVDRYDKADKFFLVGYRIAFDEEFLREFFRRNDDKYYGSYFWTPAIDVMVLAATYLLQDRANLPNFKLGTVAQHLGILPDAGLHDASVDIDLTRRVMKVVASKIIKA